MKMISVLLGLLVVTLTETSDIKGFDDTLLFDINWPGSISEELSIQNAENEHLILTTAYKEKYRCTLPNIQEVELSATDNYDGPSPLELISPLFSQSSCSYRLESYWTYEVCHGKHIRQYHEDREGKKVKVQEYNLGFWDKNYYETLVMESKAVEKESKNVPLSFKKIDGINLPYFELTMGNGTRCELNQNKPRQTKVVYVCYIHGKHEIFSFKEISTCLYEVIILSPLLCSHPKYKPQETGENEINCVPLDDNPKRPRNMMKMIQESKKLRRRSDIDHIRVEFHPLDLNEKEELPKVTEAPVDTSPVESFLAGKNCLNGGTGWWKYEFCYGKTVEQYHIEKDGSKTSINLGRFNKAKHLEWLELHPQKRPKPKGQRTQLSHLYSDGSVCDKTGKARQTEVKLKCLDNASNVNAVSLYLLEPRYCEYILGVESPLICDILARADENGLIENVDDDAIIEDEISTVNIIRS
ncbi:endoplasmic reticulum lectin 1 [Photinus pyralis]|uniref:Endoplasmic reticulum lectin 1 n=2 Tax=Photinus pyralis TaxID=7054 RepID=A0A1Y1LS51_PHOPY|nr:endoplasmic reticulum lectin 1 [Photinus pyralis]